MLSKETMKNSSYVYCYSLFVFCGLTFVSIIVSSPPLIYTYKSVVSAFLLSCIIVGLTVIELKVRKVGGYNWKPVAISLIPSTVLILFSIPSIVWVEYHFSDFDKQVVVNVENKKITYYRNSISCYKLSLKNAVIDGNLCSSSRMYANSPLYGEIEVRYETSPFGYLIKD
ncbi:hypothetical protein [Photobacterium satsumensis]|uniref:hypothetical protein n=1 Tax=Photobacterium satsumensis TaxID=2910239 RepID=UPI003D0B21BE